MAAIPLSEGVLKAMPRIGHGSRLFLLPWRQTPQGSRYRSSLPGVASLKPALVFAGVECWYFG